MLHDRWGYHRSHSIRSSDSSFYDLKCNHCGYTDNTEHMLERQCDKGAVLVVLILK